MNELGIFCTVARTELKEKVVDVCDDTLKYLNYAIKQAYNLGLAITKEEIINTHMAGQEAARIPKKEIAEKYYKNKYGDL